MRAALIAACLAVALAGCKSSSDRIVGPLTSTSKGPKACEHQCRKDAHFATRDERHRHHQALKDCVAPDCIVAEDAQHLVILAEIESTAKDCLGVCGHDQGSGAVGQ